MSVWAFYNTASEAEIEYCKSNKKANYTLETNLPFFEYNDMGRWWRLIHKALVGSETPNVNNILSNTIIGRYHLWGDDEKLIKEETYWCDFYSIGYIDVKRVTEISGLLENLNFEEALREGSAKFNLESYIKGMIYHLKVLKRLYKNASEHNLCVEISFG